MSNLKKGRKSNHNDLLTNLLEVDMSRLISRRESSSKLRLYPRTSKLYTESSPKAYQVLKWLSEQY